MAKEVVGFIGLGNMGKPMADNITRVGYDMVVFDIAGTAERAPQGATICRVRARCGRTINNCFSKSPNACRQY